MSYQLSIVESEMAEHEYEALTDGRLVALIHHVQGELFFHIDRGCLAAKEGIKLPCDGSNISMLDEAVRYIRYQIAISS